MKLVENELCDVRSVSGIIQYAKRTVVSNSQRLLEIIPIPKSIGVDTLNVREYINNTRVSASSKKLWNVN